MHGFWGVLEWGANTILFVWMGIVLAIVLPPSHEGTKISSLPIHLEARDAGYVVVLYLWLQVTTSCVTLVTQLMCCPGTWDCCCLYVLRLKWLGRRHQEVLLLLSLQTFASRLQHE